jgi:NDP-sugar pyrophosphorylase family protein
MQEKYWKIIKGHDFQNKDNFGEILSFLYKGSSVYGKVFDEFWIDIGSKEELEKARQHFSADKQVV